MQHRTDIDSLWVALVDFEFVDGPDEDGCVGAFAWAVCEASDVAEFEHRVRASLKTRGASVLGWEQVETLSERIRRERLSKELRRLVHPARSASDPAFGQWQRYPDD